MKLLESLVPDFVMFRHRYGKARRITLCELVSSALLEQLYQAFHCVEFMNSDGECVILDDGHEEATVAKVV